MIRAAVSYKRMDPSVTEQTAAAEAEALEWTLRVQDPEFADWDALTAWLAADPRHAEGFHRLTLLDDEIATALRESPPPPAWIADVRKPGLPPRTRPAGARPSGARPSWAPPSWAPPSWAPPPWALLAAGLALALALGAVVIGRARLTASAAPSRLVVATRAGERRQLRLADGTEIVVAGATRLSIDPAGRRAQLDEGQATFAVRHDPMRRFVVRLGDATITDVGTVFDLRRRDGRSVVAVAKGEVRVDGVGAPVELVAGCRLRFAGASAPEFDVISPSAATGWQQGRFSYDDATIADVEHATGARIRLSPHVGAQRFAGTIMVTGDAGQAQMRRDGGGFGRP
jgi:transmembrane sensor